MFLVSNVRSDNILNNPSNNSGKYITKSIEGISFKIMIQETMNFLANISSEYIPSLSNGTKLLRSKLLEFFATISFKNDKTNKYVFL